MRIVFMGTPDFAVPTLRTLNAHHIVTLVVTRPDAVRGRGKRLEPSPVKAAALELGLPVLEAKRLSEDDIRRVAQEQPDVICVAAYGAILSDELLAIPPHGVLNVHASLLPRGRGAAPIQRAVLDGDKEAGVSIMRIVHDLDAGPYCRQASVLIDDKPCLQVMQELAELGAGELVTALADQERGELTWTEQDESQVTYAAKVTKAQMLLDPADDAATNKHRVQASLDAAPARAIVAGKGVRVTFASVASQSSPSPSSPLNAGEVRVQKGRVFLGCADSPIEVLRVKPDGKREMEARAWASGLRGEDLRWARA